MSVKLFADNFVGIRRVVQDGPVLLRVWGERRGQLVGRDTVPLRAELVAKLLQEKKRNKFIKVK